MSLAFSLRTLALGSFFVALAAFEVAQALRRWQSLRRSRTDELAALTDRGHSELVRELAFQLADEREHASYIASKPAVRELLSERTEPARQRATADVLACLVAFEDIDRLSLSDELGREWLRCERIGEGVGVLPPELLALSPLPALEELLAALVPGATRESSIVDDQERVEMPPSKRQVIHLACGIFAEDTMLGHLVMTVYAAPLLEALHAFVPIPGARTLFVDTEGLPLVRNGREPERSLALSYPAAWAEVARGASAARSPEAWLFARPLELGAGGRVVTVVPRAAIELALAPLQRELRRILLTMLGVTLAIGIGAIFFLRQSLAALRMRETERYLLLVHSESAKWKALTESAADLIWIVEAASGSLRECNPRAAQILAGRALEDCLSAQDYAVLQRGLTQAAEVPHQPLTVEDVRLRAQGGEEHILQARLVGLDLGGERVVEVALRDVTRERAMERQLSINERLSSLGLLTAGVAHEINNPLEGIGNYLSLLAREDLPKERRLHYVQNLRIGFERIRDIVRNLLNFARPGVEHGEADLAVVIERARTLFGYGKKYADVEFDISAEGAAAVVAADPGRLEQVLLNLMINAATAMQGRGSLRIRVRAVHDDEGSGPAYALAVEDSGPGIPIEHLSRIFDPFFTTTQGTGLGLSVSYGIVRAYGGRISAENRPEGGARFTIVLPKAKLTTPSTGTTA